MATQKKIDTVAELTDKLSRAKAFVLADYRGLKHKQLEELHTLLKKVEGEFVVAKNRLFKRALRENSGQALGDKAKELESHLHETTALLFSYADEVAPLKELLKFFKVAGFGKAKAGYFDGQIFEEAQVMRLSTIPSRQILLSQLVGQLNAPIQGLHYALSWNMTKLVYALNAVKDSKGLN